MLQKTKDIYNKQIFSQIAEQYGLAPQKFKLLDGFENFIYEFRQNDLDLILRVTHSLHRDMGQIKAEVDWVNYLVDNGVSASGAVLSPGGNLIERIDLPESYFMAVAFQKAEGRHVGKEDISTELFQKLGRMIGKMHFLTKSYIPTDKSCLRPYWYNETTGLHNFIPEDQEIVKFKFEEILNNINRLEKDDNSFGLIHTDAHFGNMFINEGKLTLFDFDDSAYKWFISDIAIVIFYGIMRLPEKKTLEEFGEFIFRNFMQGYRLENELDPYWFELMPEFLKLREIVLYAVIYMGFDVENLQDPWCKWYLNGRKEKIEQNIPYLDLNFKKIAQQ